MGRVINAIFAFISIGFLIHYWAHGNVAVGQAKYGTYVTIFEYIAIFASLADLGIFTIAVREMAKKTDEVQEIFSSALTLRIVSLLFALAVASVIAYLIPAYQGTEIPYGVFIAGIGTGIFILSGTISTIFLIHLKMKYQSFALVIGKIVTFALTLAIIFFFVPEPTEESFYQIIWTGVLGSAVTLIVTILYARKYVSLRPNKNIKLIRELFDMAIPFGIAIFLNTIYFRLDITMMGIILPHSDDAGICSAQFCGDIQTGIYAVAVRIVEVIVLVPIYFMNSVLPSLSHSAHEKNEKQLQGRLSLCFFFLLLISVPASVGLYVLAKPIVELVTPENFGSENALQILSPLLLFIFFTTFFNFVLIALGEQKKILWINFGALLFNFLLNIYAIPKYGYIGASVTSLISEVFILVWGTYFVFRHASFRVHFRQILGTIFASFVMGFFAYFSWKYWGSSVGKTSLGIIIPLSVAVYTAMLIASRAIDKTLLRLFKKQEEEEEED